ncbi:unnamed protein product [Thelazia callipaeda]|uniref:Uncharacterized protein n=1 Tax=Thelazia callipaeda TaxID=103827 RepID=A0A0N5CX26_THECL|nr:unnamed protein product [Thelazia callipaeda]
MLIVPSLICPDWNTSSDGIFKKDTEYLYCSGRKIERMKIATKEKKRNEMDITSSAPSGAPGATGFSS